MPGELEPVVAGRLDLVGVFVTFTYGRSYLERRNAISLYEPELPLRAGSIAPEVDEIAGCIADAAPTPGVDGWC